MRDEKRGNIVENHAEYNNYFQIYGINKKTIRCYRKLYKIVIVKTVMFF